MTDFDFDHIDNEQESHQDELEGFRAVEAIYKELLDHARQRIAELEAKPKDDPIHQQESQRYMVHLWNTSATGIECGIEAGTVVGKSRIAEVDCAECITSLNSQPEPHKFVPWDDELAQAKQHIADLHEFMVRVARAVNCLPSFTDPAKSNEHIFRAIERIKQG